MSYNAVLRKDNGEVLGRLLLTNLKTLPRACKVSYGENFIPKTTDLKTLLCDSKFPLSVYTVPVKRTITVKRKWNNFDHSFSVYKNAKVKDLKQLIREKTLKMEGKVYKMSMQYLFHNKKLLKDGDKIFKEFLFQRNCTLHLKIIWPIKRIGAGPGNGPRVSTSVKSVDLKAKQVEEEGVPVRNRWEGYSYGLNIYGTCSNKSCPSHKILLRQTSYRAGYGFLRIDLNNQTFRCPACREKFPPANFAVCDGRALFRFKKTESLLEVESSLLQSFGGIDEYAMFIDDGEETHVEYDWIEVKTVKEDESFHDCSRCDIPIKMKVDAALYDCGHPVHRACMENECGICRAQRLSDKEFNDLVNNATAKKAKSSSRELNALVINATGWTADSKAGPSGTGGKRKRKLINR